MRALGKWEKSYTDERCSVFFRGIYGNELTGMTVLETVNPCTDKEHAVCLTGYAWARGRRALASLLRGQLSPSGTPASVQSEWAEVSTRSVHRALE